MGETFLVQLSQLPADARSFTAECAEGAEKELDASIFSLRPLR
jgi:hypothetical protein